MATVFMRHILRPLNPFSSLLLPYSSPFSSSSSSALRQLQQEPESVSLPNSILETLVKCRTLRHLSQIHALFITSGYTQKPFFAAKLLKLSCELKDLDYTLSIFRNIALMNRVCVNAVISAYSVSSEALQGVIFYFEMLKVGFFSNSFSFPPLLSCCSRSGCSISGQKCHGQAIKRGVDGIVDIQNCLIHMYGCFGLIDAAAEVFDIMHERDLVSWHSLIGAYCKVGDVQKAHRLFDVMPVKNVVSWNVMMTGYLDNHKPGLVLKLFRQMEKAGFIGNSSTLVSVITASGRSARLKEGMSVHGFLVRRNWGRNLILDTAIIDLYSKCRKLEAARKTFDRLSERNLVCWNAMVMGYCLHGNPLEGLDLFEEMIGLGITPDAITFVSVLCACTRGSLLERGRDYFQQMVQMFGVRPNFAHYWCMANLLASNGLTEEAVEFVRKVDELNADMSSESVIWASLLGLCRFQGRAEPGEHVAKSLIQLEPENIMCYALLFNVYGAAGRWDDVLALKASIREKFGETKENKLFARDYFQQMVQMFGVRPNFAHYWCMANLLASNGLTEEAVEFVRKVDELNADMSSESVIWASLLGLCRFQGRAEPGEQVAKSLIQLEPENIMCYALLFNVYGAAGRWDDVLALKAAIREKFGETKVGSSLTDLIEIVHKFTVEKSSIDELFRRQDLACLLPSKLHSQKQRVH